MKKLSQEDLSIPKLEEEPGEKSMGIETPQWAIKNFKSLGEFGAGDKRHQGKHDGIDLGANRGVSVYPILSGVVKKIYKETGTWKEGMPKQGNAILIVHPEYGLESFYAHLEKIMVSEGQKVDQQTTIATNGNSGNAISTSPHVHLEVRKNKIPINPRSIIGREIDKAPQTNKLSTQSQRIRFLKKFAVKDVPKWAPLPIKKVLKRTEKIEKDPRLIDFREAAPPDLGNKLVPPAKWEIDLIANLDKSLQDIKYFLESNFDDKEISAIESKKLNNIKKLISLYFSLSLEEQINGLRTNTIIFGKQEYRFMKFYNGICNLFSAFIKGHGLSFGVKLFNEFPEFDSWSGRTSIKDKKYWIVFSTKFQDIIGMSSRSEWTSCQDIRSGAIGFSTGVVGSCLSRYVGIIYLTDAQDFEGRGERMYYRCAVWLIRNTSTDEDILFIQRMYPSFQQNVMDLFKKALDRLNMPIETYIENDQGYFNAPEHLKKYYEETGYSAYDDAELLEHFDPTNQKHKDYITNKIINERDYKFLKYAYYKWTEYPAMVSAALNNTPASYALIFFIENVNPKWDQYKDYLLMVIRRLDFALYYRYARGEISYDSLIFKISKQYKVINLVDKNNPKYKELVYYLVDEAYCFLKKLDKNWEYYKELVIKTIQKEPLAIQYADKSWKEYNELAIAAIKADPDALGYVDEKLPGYNDLAFAAAEKDPETFAYLLDKKDPRFIDFIFRHIKEHPYLIYKLDQTTPGYREAAIALIDKDPSFFDLLEPNCKEYDEAIMKVIESGTLKLHHLNRNWHLYKRFVLEAVEKLLKNIDSADLYEITTTISYLDPSWKEYKDIVVTCAKKYPEVLNEIDSTSKQYRYICFALAKQDDKYMEYIDEDWEESEAFITSMLRKHPKYITYADTEWTTYKDMATYICSKNPENIKYINKQWSGYKNFILENAKKNLYYIQYANPTWAEYKDLIIYAIERDSKFIEMADPNWVEYKDLVEKAAKKDPWYLRYLEE